MEGREAIRIGILSNRTIKTLELPCSEILKEDSLDSILCDTESIESIYNSNHILESIVVQGARNFSLLVQDCLQLNSEANMDVVIRMKIARYYLNGSFDMSPFASMPASLLLEVMRFFRSIVRDPLNAFFILLSSRPELCAFSGDDRAETIEDIKDNESKRQRIQLI